MSTLTPCPACARHVNADSSTCPFCDARLSRRSVGRGLAAAAGAGLVLATVGCPDSSTAIPEGQPAQGQATGEGVVGDGEGQAAEGGAADGSGAAAAEPGERAVAPPYGAVPPPPKEGDSSADPTTPADEKDD